MRDKPTKLKFHITREKYENLTLEALIAIEDFQAGGTNFRGLRDLLSPFLIDEQGKEVPLEQARRLIGQIPMGQIKTVAAEFSARLLDFAVPKGNETA